MGAGAVIGQRLGGFPIGHKALQPANRDGFVLLAQHARAFTLAFLRADAPGDGGQGVGLLDHIHRGLEIALLDVLEEARGYPR